MPVVELPDGREVEFPEGVTPEQMTAALRRDFASQFAPAITPLSPEQVREITGAAASREDLAFQNVQRARQLGNAPVGPAAPGLWEAINTPIVNLPHPSRQTSAGLLTAMAQLNQNEGAGGEVAPISPASKTAKIATGVGAAGADLLSFFTSPLGIATLGIGSLPAAAQRVVAGGFALQMASETPKLASELGTELGKPEQDRDYEKIAQLTTAGVANTGMAALSGAHALAPRVDPKIQLLREALAQSPEMPAGGASVPASRLVSSLAPPPEGVFNLNPAPKGGEPVEPIQESQRPAEVLSPPEESPATPVAASPQTENVPAAAESLPAAPEQSLSQKQTEQTETGLPAVKPGFVRMFHGGIDPRGKFSGDRDITQNLAYAKGYADKNGNPVWYVDVPETSAFMHRDEGASVPGGKSYWNMTKAPAEIMKGARLVPDSSLPPPLSPLPPVQPVPDPATTLAAQRAERIKRKQNELKKAQTDLAQIEAKLNPPSGSAGGSGHGSTAYPPLNFPKLESTIPPEVARVLRPMETPEILRLATELSGSVPALKKLKRYMAYARAGQITMDYEAFRDPQRLAMTLAHELGHVNDWFPEGTMKRGNLIGRLIGSVNQFLKGTFGGLNNKELRQELVDLSAYWHPWDRDKAPESYRKYRDSAVELYAEAVSVLLNSPGLLEQRAPKFYKAFFEHLDAKPKFKKEFFALQDLLARVPEAVLGERLKQSREVFEQGEAMLHEKIQLREAARNSFKDFFTKVRIQSLDIADFVRRKLGSKDPRQPSQFDRLYEESKLDYNRNAADVSQIYHEMIQPLVKTGLDEHAFGQVLELQRIIGGLDAYRDMQAMRKALGPDKMALLSRMSDKLAELERKGVAGEQAIEQVIIPLENAGLEFDLIDRFRQLREAQGTRAELANPQGRSPIMAEAELNQLLNSVTPEQRAALTDASAKFRNLIFQRATEARDVGIISKLTYDKTIVPNKDNYAAFRPLDKIEPFVTPMVRRAKGALNDIENPFITTLLKLQSLNNLIELQRLKHGVRDMMTAQFPGEFVKAPVRWTGRRMEAVPAKPGVGRVDMLENGKLVGYDADPYVAKMFDKLTPTDSFWLNKLLEVPFRMGIYPLIIKYNPGFLFAFNPRRDMARTVRNLYAVEGVTRRELLPNYADPQVLGAVSDYLAGRPNPLAQQMIKAKAITTSWQGFSRIDQQDVMTDLLRRYKLAATPEKNKALRATMYLPNKLNEAGSFLEALPKFASFKTLIDRGVGEERAAWLVRNYAGTPNFSVKGEWASVQNSYLPFMNIFLQGWRADLKLATSPRTAGGWWMQWMLQHGWQATMVGLASAGVFGPQLKKLYDGISEYDKTNYGTLPLGSQKIGEFGHKTVYLRTPRDETSRFFSAMTYKATRAIADKAMGNPPHPQGLPAEAFAFGAGVLPSPTPILDVAGAWKDYLAGQNPIDPFRNQPVIGERNFAAGGASAAGDMMTWTLEKSGALNLFKWNPRAETVTEATLSGTPILNRLVKVSDQGLREQQMNDKTLTTQQKAKLRVQYNDNAQSLVAQHAWLESLGPARRTEPQNELYQKIHVWKTQAYDPADEAAWNLRDNKAEQQQVIKEINASADVMKKELK